MTPGDGWPTAEELAEWARLCELATPGPWNYDLLREVVFRRFDGATSDSYEPDPQTQEAVALDIEVSDADGVFIAAARTALPKLLNTAEWAVTLRPQLVALVDAWTVAQGFSTPLERMIFSRCIRDLRALLDEADR